jgi:hypothetical protein
MLDRVLRIYRLPPLPRKPLDLDVRIASMLRRYCVLTCLFRNMYRAGELSISGARRGRQSSRSSSPHHTPPLLCIASPRLDVGYSTSSVTRHRRLLDIVGYSTSSVTQHRRLLNIVGDSTSSTLSTIGIMSLIKNIQDY